MIKSVIAAALIIIITATSVVLAFNHTIKTVDDFKERLDKAYMNPVSQDLKNISDEWDKEKKSLMFLINHRDVEAISVSILRAYEESAAGRPDMAIQEISVAKFQLEELVEREKFSFENIF